MKKLIITTILSCFLISFNSCKDDKKSDSRADEKNVIDSKEVPQAVNAAFTTKYSGVSEVIWEDAHEGTDETYKVKFKRDGKYWKAEFKSDGSLVKEKEDD